MKNKYVVFFVLLLHCSPLSAQYLIEGRLTEECANKVVYLDMLNEWDAFSSIWEEMIIKSYQLGENGEFKFEGSELPNKRGLYRIRYSELEERVSIGPSNHVVFSFSNTDTIQIHNDLFIPNNASNEELLKQTKLFYNYRQEIKHSENATYAHLITSKYQSTIRNYLKQSSDPFSNLYSLYKADLNINKDLQLFQKVSNELNSPEIRDHYHLSLQKVINEKEFPALEKSSQLLFYLLVGSLLLNVVLFALYFKGKSKRKETPPTSQKEVDLSSLTTKEMEIVKLIVLGKTNKEIAADIFVAETTVKTHINNIYRKLNIKSRKQVIELYKAKKSTPI